jgi:cobalt/nickel transport system permease protein
MLLKSLPLYLGLHIPDGFLNLPVIGITWIVAIALTLVSIKKVEARDAEKAVPLMSACAAFIFAAQMVNFPIPGGTSGHLLGGTLAGILLGPWAGSLVMGVVFIVQALMFQDGGITVLGANIINMGIIGCFGGYYLYQTFRSISRNNEWIGIRNGAAIGSWLSVMLGALATTVELALSGTVSWSAGFYAMMTWHAAIGIGEALITVITLSYIWRTRRDLFYVPKLKIN